MYLLKTLHELGKNFVELVLLVVACGEGAGFFRAKGEIVRTHKGRKGKEAPAAETLVFNLLPQNDMTALHASTDKKLIESRLSNDMEPTSDPFWSYLHRENNVHCNFKFRANMMNRPT